jgi:galactose mutarotase-like enzyme
MSDLDLKTVRLHDRAGELEAEFVPGAGMLCCSLRHRGEELLAQNRGVAAYAQRGKTMGIPLLYPWANRLAAFDYAVGGVRVRVPHDPGCVAIDQNGRPIHGVVGGRLAWRLDDPPADDAGSLVARLRWSDLDRELFEVFPFAHELQYRARLAHGRLEVELTVHATGADPVPLAFGLHPYLSTPGVARERWLIELPAMRHLALDAGQIPTGPDEQLPARSFQLGEQQFDDGFDSVAAPAKFAVQGAGRRIELALLEGYPCAQVYAPLGGQFICFEPMTAPANALRSGDGLALVEPGERRRAVFSVSVSPAP